MASVNDKITDVRNGARPNSARVTVARLVAGTTLQCNSLVGWPTASKVHFVTYQVDSNNDAVPSTQIDCSGIVSGNDITQITVIDGTDAGNSIGDVVEMLPTAAWGQDLADALGQTLERTGELKEDVVDTANIVDDAVEQAQIADDAVGQAQLADNAVGTSQIIDDAVTAPKLVGIDKSNLTTDSNPYKFKVNGSQTMAASTQSQIILSTETFDTNSNFASNTYTVPVTGYYWIGLNVLVTAGAGGEGYVLHLYKNGGLARQATFWSTAGTTHSVDHMISDVFFFTAGDLITGQFYNSVAALRGIFSSMQGFLISRT